VRAKYLGNGKDIGEIMPSAALRNQRPWRWLPPLAASLLLGACVEEPAAPAAEADGNLSALQAGRTPGQIATELVAAQLAIAPATVRILEVEEQVFGDASLGCPEPDMFYAQVLTPGYRVIVEAEGRRFDVRVAGDSGRICHRKQLPSTLRSPSPVEQAAALARADLATRTGLDASEIRLLGQWPARAGNEALACTVSCPEPASTECGLLLLLAADDREYGYHVIAGEAHSCTEMATAGCPPPPYG